MPSKAATPASWKPGESGHRAGRLRALKSRNALRRALLDGPPEGRPMDRWARELVEQAKTFGERMELLRFVEGDEPPKPRILIPGLEESAS